MERDAGNFYRYYINYADCNAAFQNYEIDYKTGKSYKLVKTCGRIFFAINVE